MLINWSRRSFSVAVSSSAYTFRSHTCNDLSIKNKGENVTVMGWLAYKRMDRFLVIRDSYGSIQAVVPSNSKFKSILKELPYESVVQINGIVLDREKNRNLKLKTGEIEIEIKDLKILNRASSAIPMLPDVNTTEKTRLQYRYIDLRTEKLQKSLRLRSNLVHNFRRFLVEKRNFVDVETPTLFRRTPGGATEFLVPAPPPNNGLAYSLPQSPQQFKQLLMVGGIDRYFQIARCYRDEGSKGDRQPEFTQVDVEMSFTTQEGVMQLIEDMILSAWPEQLEKLKPKSPFPRISYNQAIDLYGIDKPDMRIPWKIEDDPIEFFNFLRKNEESWKCRIIICRDAASAAEKEKQKITNSVQNEWKRLIEMNENGTKFAVCNSNNKWFKQISKQLELKDNDILVVSWGKPEAVQWTLGQLRNYVADACGLREKKEITAHWVVDFPLFSIENGELVSTHHPFTAPIEKDKPDLFSENQEKLLNITAQHYDLVINGVEMGGGSIRIHNSDIQKHILNILNEPMKEMKHLLDALSFGAPPHGGFALGLDRFAALLTSEGNPNTPVRDVIAFPKTKNGKDLMSDSPATMSEKQLKRYGIEIRKVEKSIIENS